MKTECVSVHVIVPNENCVSVHVIVLDEDKCVPLRERKILAADLRRSLILSEILGGGGT